MSALGVGIVGWGSIAAVHAEVLHGRDDVQLRAVCRRGPERPTGLRDDVAVVVGMDDMLADADIDVVVICSPTGQHAQQAITALEAGKHVVIEKPLARHPADAQRVLAAEACSAHTVSVISQRRFEPAVRAVRHLITSGVLGRPILIEGALRWSRGAAYYAQADWRGTIEEDGGALLNQGIHVIDLMRWLGGPVLEVQGATATLVHDIEAEDTAAATFRFASGALGLIAATTATGAGAPGELTFVFERGSLTLTEGGITRWNVPGVTQPSTGTGDASGAADPGAIGNLGHTRQWEDILEAIAGGRPPAVGGADGSAALELVDAVYRSSRTGQVVALRSGA